MAAGRRRVQNTLHETSLICKRNINDGSVLISWHLMFSDNMMHNIKQYTETEECHQFNLNDNTWFMSVNVLDEFISIL